MFQRSKMAFIQSFIIPMVMKDGINGTRQSYQVYKYLKSSSFSSFVIEFEFESILKKYNFKEVLKPKAHS